MLRLVVIVLVIIVALLRGGSLRNFSDLKLRWLPLVIIGFVLQLLIFTPQTQTPLIGVATLPLYILSLTLLTIWVGANWRIPGMLLIALGLFMNIAAVAANDGHMPVSPEGARIAGKYEAVATADPQVSKQVFAVEGQTRLWFLTDIIAIPKEVPGAAVMSVGDVVLTIGIGMLCYQTIRAAPVGGELAQVTE